jgi:hypothetical protein
MATLPPPKLFIKVDFPTDGRPTTATKAAFFFSMKKAYRLLTGE